VDTCEDPPASTWLQTEHRTPQVTLRANTGYWNRDRGPNLQEVIFRNDLAPAKALDLVCDNEGEVDIVTDIQPKDVDRIKKSQFAKLVSTDAVRVLAGVFNRESDRFPFGDKRARRALNLAIDRKQIVSDALLGFATPLAGLTPLSATAALPHRLSPYPHDPEKALKLWQQTTASAKLPLRLAAEGKWFPVADLIRKQIQAALGLSCQLTIFELADMPRVRRRLAEKKLPQLWDLLLMDQGAQLADSPPLEMHRAFVGKTGEFRAGPVSPQFEHIYDKLVRQTSLPSQAKMAYRLDRFVYDEALALFICAPYNLYAVNKQVNFDPYRTTFELAECTVTEKHWSRSGDSTRQRTE